MGLNQTAINLLHQIETVLLQMEDRQYQQGVEILSGSSIGQHVRHTVEFFICLMSAQNGGLICYDDRKRDKYLEQEIDVAVSFIKSISRHLQKQDENFSFELKASYGCDSEVDTLVGTSFLRELAYNIEHTIHHMALIKVGIQMVCPAMNLPEHFGVASSTVRYQQKQA